jgi:adenine-specific DNA-methyltransferase
MMKQITQRKAHGAHFTPYQLACFVAKRIVNSLAVDFFHSKEMVRVLDPSCGDGELLLAFAEVMPPEYLKKIIFLGVESDEQSLSVAKQRLKESLVERFELERADFLQLSQGKLAQPSVCENFLDSKILADPVDIIIANPPYVRTQILGAIKAQELARSFGRIDLYQAFLVAMTCQLSPHGLMGVITSNRFLFTKGGAAIRELLASNYDMLELYDLGDTKLFEAAVLPAIFLGRKTAYPLAFFADAEGRQGRRDWACPCPPSLRTSACEIGISERKLVSSPSQKTAHVTPLEKFNRGGGGKFVRVYEHASKEGTIPCNSQECDSVYSVLEVAKDGNYKVSGRCLKVSTGVISLPASSLEPWSMVTHEEQAWLNQIHAQTKFRLYELVKVRVGIKTTADEVFIRKNWDDLAEEMRPEEDVLRSLVSQEDAERWVLKKEPSQLRRILYTHKIENGRRVAINLNHYPRSAAYLESYRERLASRSYVLEAKRHWYEIWVPQNPSLWAQPKLILPDISPDPRFSYDDHGYLVDGNCYWMTLDEKQDRNLLFLIAGVANSKLMTCYHDLVFHNKLYAGRRRYLTQYVAKYPLPDPESFYSQQIIALVKDLIFSSAAESERKQRESDLEKLVYQAFQASPL